MCTLLAFVNVRCAYCGMKFCEKMPYLHTHKYIYAQKEVLLVLVMVLPGNVWQYVVHFLRFKSTK